MVQYRNREMQRDAVRCRETLTVQYSPERRRETRMVQYGTPICVCIYSPQPPLSPSFIPGADQVRTRCGPGANQVWTSVVMSHRIKIELSIYQSGVRCPGLARCPHVRTMCGPGEDQSGPGADQVQTRCGPGADQVRTRCGDVPLNQDRAINLLIWHWVSGPGEMLTAFLSKSSGVTGTHICGANPPPIR